VKYQEIERKFLVADTSVLDNAKGTGMAQGYLHDDADRTVRIRQTSEGSYILTVKGPREGATRVELECEVPDEIGEQLIAACSGVLVSKTRYPIIENERLWIVDVFQDLNDGLVLAEIELSSPTEPVTIPAWCSDEVTDDERYYNNYLARHPYTTWNDEDT
jgi:adenylate cyclase